MGGVKGFFRLKAVLDDLWNERQDFILNVFFRKEGLPPYIKQHDRYSYSQLKSIMDKTDVLVTPSVWNETFGYTVAEALSYGVPVIVSSHVGAKDIVPAGAGIVFDDEKELKNAIISLTPKKLESINQMILKAFQIQTVESFNKELRENVY